MTLKIGISFIAAAITFVLSADGNAADTLQPILRCSANYADTNYFSDTQLSQDPYQSTSLDVFGRFRLRTVMVGEKNHIQYIKVYVYFQTSTRDLPLHQATYLPPFSITQKAQPLTPLSYAYAPDMERELKYQCMLIGVKK